MADEPMFKLSDVKNFVNSMFQNQNARATNYPVPDFTQQPPAHPNVGYSQDAPWEAPQAMLAPGATSHSPLEQIALLRQLQAKQAQQAMAHRIQPMTLYQAANVGGSYADRLKDLNFWEDPRKNFS